MKITKTIEVTKEEVEVLNNFFDMWYDDDDLGGNKTFGEFTEEFLNGGLSGFKIIVKEG